MIRALLVDDHEVFLSGLRAVLGEVPGLHVAGTATTVAEGKHLCEALSPDLVVLDIRLPDSRGVAEVAAFKRAHPEVKIIVLTGYGVEARSDAINNGADMFLTKDLSPSEIAARIAGLFGLSMTRGEMDGLTEREKQIAELVANGLSNPQVGAALGISVNTVKTHLLRIQAKLGVNDRIGLALLWAKRRG